MSAVTHIAEVQEIKPYKDTGKYQLIFKGAPQEIGRADSVRAESHLMKSMTISRVS